MALVYSMAVSAWKQMSFQDINNWSIRAGGIRHGAMDVYGSNHFPRDDAIQIGEVTI